MYFLILDIETVPRASIDEEVEIDLMMFLCNWNSYNAVSMDIACRSFGIRSPKEGKIKGDTVARAYMERNIPGVEDYVMRDVEATHQLYKKIK